MRRNQIEAAWTGLAACRQCGIRDLVLFADLAEGDFNLIHLPIDELSFQTGATLYRHGEDGHSVFTIRAGLVKLVQFLPDGSQRIVRLLRRGAVAGLEALVGDGYEHTAVALHPVTACRIPADVVSRLSRETPRLHEQLMKRWHQALHQADEWLTELSTGSARQRVARLLLHLAEVEGGQNCELVGREDMGAMLSITTETASRTVADFKRAGMIRELGLNRYWIDGPRLETVSHRG